MSLADHAARFALLEVCATGNAANIIGAAVSFAALCGNEEEKAIAAVIDRALSAYLSIEPQQGTTRQ